MNFPLSKICPTDHNPKHQFEILQYSVLVYYCYYYKLCTQRGLKYQLTSISCYCECNYLLDISYKYQYNLHVETINMIITSNYIYYLYLHHFQPSIISRDILSFNEIFRCEHHHNPPSLERNLGYDRRQLKSHG